MWAITLIPVLVILIGIPFVGILGWAHWTSRSQIASAAEFTKQEEYKKARQLVLNATRFNTSLLKNPDVRNLYDIILSRSAAGALARIEEIKLASSTWPATRVESVATSDWFKLIAFVLVVISVLSRLTNIF